MIPGDTFKFTHAHNVRYTAPRKAHYKVVTILDNGEGCEANDMNETQTVTAGPIPYFFLKAPDIEHVNEAPHCIWTRLDGVDIPEAEQMPNVFKEDRKFLAKKPEAALPTDELKDFIESTIAPVAMMRDGEAFTINELGDAAKHGLLFEVAP